MDVDELIERAWQAVEKAGVSEVAQPAALQEAIAFIREQDGSPIGNTGGERPSPSKSRSRAQSRSKPRQPDEPSEDQPDESGFFVTLASESGVAETELRDVLLYKNGRVTVAPPTRVFGGTKTRPGEGDHNARRRSAGEGPRRGDRPRRARA